MSDEAFKVCEVPRGGKGVSSHKYWDIFAAAENNVGKALLLPCDGISPQILQNRLSAVAPGRGYKRTNGWAIHMRCRPEGLYFWLERITPKAGAQ